MYNNELQPKTLFVVLSCKNIKINRKRKYIYEENEYFANTCKTKENTM